MCSVRSAEQTSAATGVCAASAPKHQTWLAVRPLHASAHDLRLPERHAPAPTPLPSASHACLAVCCLCLCLCCPPPPLQVHAATLAGSGKEVVVKVLRPGTEDVLLTDLNFVSHQCWLGRSASVFEYVVYQESGLSKASEHAV